MTYSKDGADKTVIDHTQVDDELRGTGNNKSLVLEAIRYSKENYKKIIPLCPFAKSVFAKDDATKDVLN